MPFSDSARHRHILICQLLLMSIESAPFIDICNEAPACQEGMLSPAEFYARLHARGYKLRSGNRAMSIPRGPQHMYIRKDSAFVLRGLVRKQGDDTWWCEMTACQAFALNKKMCELGLL